MIQSYMLSADIISPPAVDSVSVLHFVPRHYMVIAVFNTVTVSRCCSLLPCLLVLCSFPSQSTYLSRAHVRKGQLFLWRFAVGYTSNLFHMNCVSSGGNPAVELCLFLLKPWILSLLPSVVKFQHKPLYL